MAPIDRRWQVAAALWLAVTTPVAQADLRDVVKQSITKSQVGMATVAVSIRDAGTGRTLVSIADDEPLIPASNLKLFTTGAALHVLGPEFAFRTELLRDGDRLTVVGDGDPGVGDPYLLADMFAYGREGIDVESFLDLWVEPVIESGMRRVSAIVVDDRIFDRDFVHDDWPADQLNRPYCAEVGGFNFHLNVLHFYPRPDRDGRPDVSNVRPSAAWLEVINRGTVKTGTHDRNDMWIARVPDRNRFTVYGNVKNAYRTPQEVTIHDPPAFFARLLAERLRQRGVEVLSHGPAADGDPEPAGEIIGPVFSTPIGTALDRCNRDSSNLYAESLCKRIGHALTNEPGSWVNGRSIIRHVVHARLNDPALAARLEIADGSGLSRRNRVAAGTVTAWLSTFYDDPELAPTYIESLAEAGSNGTLAGRFANVDLYGARVLAKSGYIRHVSCLSGFVIASDGRCRSFSILANDLTEPGSVARVKTMQEAIVAAIAEDLAETAPAAISVGGG